MAKRTDISVRLPVDLREWLIAAATDEERSYSVLAKRAIEAYLKEHHAALKPVLVEPAPAATTKKTKGAK